MLTQRWLLMGVVVSGPVPELGAEREKEVSGDKRDEYNGLI